VLDAWNVVPDAPIVPNKMGAILISREKSLLFNESRQLNIEIRACGESSRR
jgi:hypothetical protein